MFQLSAVETHELVTICDQLRPLRHSRSMPFTFTEHGALMLSSVLKSPIAIEVSRKIIKIFIELRHQLTSESEQLISIDRIRSIESEIETLKITQKFDSKRIEEKLIHTSQKLFKMSQILDEFQNTRLIINRPETLDNHQDKN